MKAYSHPLLKKIKMNNAAARMLLLKNQIMWETNVPLTVHITSNAWLCNRQLLV